MVKQKQWVLMNYELLSINLSYNFYKILVNQENERVIKIINNYQLQLILLVRL
jgi:hypothetical protein